MHLPIDVLALVEKGVVESDRLECTEEWNPQAVLRTICAFANDFHNLGGGYLILGMEEVEGSFVLPPKGIPKNKIDKVQKELLQFCNLIEPVYFPVVSIEEYQGKNLIVIWVPGGATRPYKAPENPLAKQKQYFYYIRKYANTVVPKDVDFYELISLSARIPFDDRICQTATLKDLNLGLIREFLNDVQSDLFNDSEKISFEKLCRQMAIVEGGQECLRPRNVGLMFFNQQPDHFFPQMQIDIVQFANGTGSNVFSEKIFKGPLLHMLRQALRHLEAIVIKETVVKYPNRIKSDRFFNYPFDALQEALVNAVYHRSYEIREPVEVRILADSVTITSYPGPDSSISLEELKTGQFFGRRYRNRRIGDFLKECKLTEGRGTGIPKILKAIKKNGSPMPSFITDEERTYFTVKFPVKNLPEGVEL